jgi:glutathione synthase/RimK-type ligase-like ATP-grasp enzyme
MNRIALVTSAGIPGLTADDQRLARALVARGHHATPVIWNDPNADWSVFDAAVIRSTWDYHLQPAAFDAWIGRVEAAGVRLINPGSVARWNIDKTYLSQLEARGVPVVPTRWFEPGKLTSIEDLRAATGWPDIVLKPTVSATAWQLWRAAPGVNDVPAPVRQALDTLRFMAQPFMHGITDGEWSLVFFGGEFSHAVLKTPRAGEFRVQEEYGGLATPALPDEALVTAAARVLDAAPGPSVYARVDGLANAGEFTLLELELLEPSLYLGTYEPAADRFADAILQVIASGHAVMQSPGHEGEGRC